ncbi:YALIA101S06e06304g1_1 [Yarrowia lipolytica]|nr:YALIA101S06e06304g1_1 [Yarrowia lipolytica]
MIDHQVRLPGSLATTTEPTRPATPSLLCKLVSPVPVLFDHEEISRYFSHSVFPTRLIIKLLPVLAGELHWSQPRRRLYIVSKTRF